MSAERHARTKQLFQQALELAEPERTAFLQRETEGDAALLDELRGMLAVDAESDAFLTPLAPEALLGAAGPEHPERIGPFTIVRLLGEGGMGVVYEAEQERPRRRVALKVLHAGFTTRQMLRRFELEAEVLGRLQHPGIARIYDAGADDRGRGLQPWLAMELIDGVPLAEHCARHELPLPERLVLLAKVCDAVQHAHQRGIVHRDLKPANVLVDATGEPKVLDFGIARATDDERLRATLQTDPGIIVGTLQYMSPEQASADPDAIDVRTDVYSLGSMLYELLAGRPPLLLSRLPVHEAVRRVVEEEPSPLRTQRPRIPSDVAVIAHKALAKDKQRRYASAAELAADLRRYLRREPILAQPPTRWYRLQRFVARNKALAAGTAATFAALVTGLGVALWQRNEAREALARAEGINRFLLSDLLMSPSPERLGREVRVADVLAPAVRSAERTFAGQPRVAADVLDAVGASYRALGMLSEAEQVTRRALALLDDRAEDRLALRVRGSLFPILMELDRAKEAVELGERVVAASRARLGDDDPDTLARRTDLALARWVAGQAAESIAELRAVTADKLRVLGPEDPSALATQSELAVHLAASGAMTEARELLSATLAQQERILGAGHPGVLASRNRLGWILTLASAWQEAEQIYAALLPALEDVYGADHPYTQLAQLDSAQCLLHLDRIDEATTRVRAAAAALDRRLGEQHTWSLDARLMLAECLFRSRDYSGAIEQAGHVVTQRRAGDPQSLAHALQKLGRAYQEAEQFDRARATFAEAADIFRACFPTKTDFLAQSLYNLGVVTRDSGDPAAAIAPLHEAMVIDTELWGADHKHVNSDRYNLARTYLAANDPAAAEAQLRAALASASRNGQPPEAHLTYRAALGRALLQQSRLAEAETELLAATTGLTALDLADHSAARRARADLVHLYEQQNRPDEAAKHRDRE